MATSEQPASLTLLQENFEDFFENSLCGYLTVCPEGKIIRANARMTKWLGYDKETFKTMRFSSLLSIGARMYYETHLAPLLRLQGFFDEVAIEILNQKGTRLQVLVNACEHHSENGKTQFVRFTLFKATERQIYEQNLRDAKIAVEHKLSAERETAVLREQFIAVLGHDLRNPIGAIGSGATLLAKSDLSERDNMLVKMMRDSASRMQELVENIMDFARVRMGAGVVLNRQPTQLEPVLKHVIDELRSAWPTQNIVTEFALPDVVSCDPARISQVLSNLLANALTHGSKLVPIKISAFTNKEKFELSISNGGKQIAPEALKILFQPFTREDAHSSQNGLGLGLYISSEIARAHDGGLTVTSSQEKTCFTFTMPIKDRAN